MKARKIISTLLMLPILMVGCAKAEEKKNDEIGGTIKVVTSRTDADKLFEKMEEDFKKLYPSVEDIIWESAADYDNYIMTRMNTKDYGDVLFLPFTMNGTPEEYENYFEPLGKVEELEEKYIDVTEADYDGISYGLPAAVNSLGIIYNEEVLKKAGVESMPTSTEEMIEAAKKVKENTDAIPFYTNYNKTLGTWGGTLTSYGGEQYRSEMLNVGTAFKEGQPIREIMDLFYELSSNGLIEEDPVTGDFAKSLQMLADGKVAMIMKGSQDAKMIQGLSTNNSKINIAPLPVKFNGQTSIAFGAPSVIGINKNSENKATAKAFLDFFISAKSGYADDLGGMSPSKEDLTDEQKVMFENNNIILTVPTETPEVDAKYTAIANEVGVGRLTDVLQKVINIGMYPNQNESYSDYINSLEAKWEAAVKANE
ncbi:MULTISPECIES: ABC transporter substrate-binding protein [Clostridium]|uniref:ABC transporter substrate-binding protein n=1 Tax=Clostridium TaxID=1485 RepID=UPI0018999C9C|nr:MULTISPECIES: extracellular solute-binding protein [Clostridium]MCR1951878.1 extracellular solute-binding protein [Clostridium sp. DSM 100503]MDI9216964.1 extracellular solute-binding protein [Clostridium tertium]